MSSLARTSVPVRLDGHSDLALERDADGVLRAAGYDVAAARRGGLTSAVLTVTSGARQVAGDQSGATEELDARFDAIRALASGDGVTLVRSADALRAAVDDGDFAVVLGFQNASSLADLTQLESWIDRGISTAALTFIGNNAWAESARPYPFVAPPVTFDGISPLGADAVRLLNDRGVIVDISQLSARALARVLDVSRSPVLASHNGLRSFIDVGRNLSDDELRAIASAGGVVQIVAFAPYIRPLRADVVAGLDALWTKAGLPTHADPGEYLSVDDAATADWSVEYFDEFLHEFHEVLELDRPDATVSEYVDTIDRAVEVIGIEHVGLSSDFQHAGGVVGWMSPAESASVTDELARRGYSTDEIARLWGENFLRLWRDVADAAS